MILESMVEGVSGQYKIKVTFDKSEAMFHLTLHDEDGNYLNEFELSLFALLDMAEENGANLRARQ